MAFGDAVRGLPACGPGPGPGPVTDVDVVPVRGHPPGTPSPHRARTDGHDVVLALAVRDVEEDGHAEGLKVAVRVALDGLDGQHVGHLVLLVEAALVDLLRRVDVVLVLALLVLDVLLDLNKVRGQRGPLLRRDDRPRVDAAGLEAAGHDHRPRRVPLDHPQLLLGPFQDPHQGAVAALPDVDVRVHERRRGDKLPRRRERDVVPAQPVDDVLELVLDLELDVRRIQPDPQLRQIRHDDRPDDAVRAVDEQVAPVAREAEEDHDAVAQSRRVDHVAGLRLDDVDPPFRRACDDVVP